MVNARWRLTAAVAGILVAGASTAWAAEPGQQEARIQDLEREVAALKAERAVNSKDLANTVDDILRDAERRSQLLANGSDVGAGYDNGFFIRSGNDFRLHPYLQFQARYATNWRDNQDAEGDDDWKNGFELRRMKFGFDGNVLSPDLTYHFLWATDRKSGQPKLEEAFAKYMFADAFGVRVGQFKDPVAHEGLTSSKKLLAVERTYLQDVIGLGDNFVQGVTMIYQEKNGPVRFEGGFTDGIGSANTDFTGQTVTGTPANFGLAGRVDIKAMGDWKAYEDMTALGTKDNLLVFGAGGDWTQTGDTNAFLHTADVQFETPSGLALYGAYLARYTQDTSLTGGGAGDLYDWGFVAQVAYLIDQKHWEVFARYDLTNFDKDGLTADAENQVHEITTGVNYYFSGHTAKFTVDVSWLPNGAVTKDDGADILQSNDQDEFVLRAQFQLLI